MSDKPNVVLVHGGFVDGSGWQGVYDLLTADGYRVSVVQNPTLSLAAGESVNTLLAGFPASDPSRRSCRRRTAFSSSTAISSTHPSPVT